MLNILYIRKHLMWIFLFYTIYLGNNDFLFIFNITSLVTFKERFSNKWQQDRKRIVIFYKLIFIFKPPGGGRLNQTNPII
jgi:hypothetical protein